MNLYEPFDQWWCCLNPRERNTIKLLTTAWFSNNEYILQSSYFFIAITTGLAGLTQVNQYFQDHYGLTDGFIYDPDGLPIPVFFFDTTLWPLLYAFAFTSNYLCDDPCEAFEFWT